MKQVTGCNAIKVLAISLIALSLASGCATKNYPIEGYMMPGEADALTCRELYLKQIEAQGIRNKIQDTANTNWRSVAAFLQDYGIGNLMARRDADRAITQRINEITMAQSRKGCYGAFVDESTWHRVPSNRRR